MTNYTILRVTDLKDLLSRRKLPTNGKKEELISRLEAADREAATPPVATPTSAADATAHLPSAEEYEINWDEDDTAATGPKSAKPTPAKQETSNLKKVVLVGADSETAPKTVGAQGEKKSEDQEPAQSKDGKKPFAFKRLADQFSDLPSTKKPDTKKKPEASKEAPTPATEKKKEEAVQPEPETEAKTADPEPSFAAGLAPTPLDVELEKRKARAARFGAEQQVDPTAAESLKKLERAARFGAAAGAGATADADVGVKGLDQALPERKGKRAGENVSAGGARGGVQKRARYGDRGQRRHGGSGGGNTGGDGRSGGYNNPPTAPKKAGGVSTSKSVLEDPLERDKAERRKNRFGAPA